MELIFKNYWWSIKMRFNAIRNLSVCEGVDLNNNLIFKLQQFIPKKANINCLVFFGDCSRTDMQIKMGNNKKLKDIVAIAYTFLTVTACAEVKVVISYQ